MTSTQTKEWTSQHTGQTYPLLEQYNRLHLYVSVVGIITAGVLVVAARRWGRSATGHVVRQVSAIVLGMMAVVYLAYTLHPDRLVADETLPFHICDILRIVAPFALGTGNELAYVLTYFWGLFLTPMGLMTPDAAWVVDRRVQETAYWVYHWAVFIIAAVLTFGYGYRPTWKGYRVTMGITTGWAAVTGVVNKLSAGNYGFLARKPRGSSIIDLFGPWPFYIIVEAILVTGGFALFTWVWGNNRGKRQPLGLSTVESF